MTSGIAVGAHPKPANGYQALAFQPIIRHPGLGRQGLREVPVALAADRREDCLTFTRAQCQKIADFGAHPVNFRYGSVVVRDAEILHAGVCTGGAG